MIIFLFSFNIVIDTSAKVKLINNQTKPSNIPKQQDTNLQELKEINMVDKTHNIS